MQGQPLRHLRMCWSSAPTERVGVGVVELEKSFWRVEGLCIVYRRSKENLGAHGVRPVINAIHEYTRSGIYYLTLYIFLYLRMVPQAGGTISTSDDMFRAIIDRTWWLLSLPPDRWQWPWMSDYHPYPQILLVHYKKIDTQFLCFCYCTYTEYSSQNRNLHRKLTRCCQRDSPLLRVSLLI